MHSKKSSKKFQVSKSTRGTDSELTHGLLGKRILPFSEVLEPSSFFSFLVMLCHNVTIPEDCYRAVQNKK